MAGPFSIGLELRRVWAGQFLCFVILWTKIVLKNLDPTQLLCCAGLKCPIVEPCWVLLAPYSVEPCCFLLSFN